MWLERILPPPAAVAFEAVRACALVRFVDATQGAAWTSVPIGLGFCSNVALRLYRFSGKSGGSLPSRCVPHRGLAQVPSGELWFAEKLSMRIIEINYTARVEAWHRKTIS